MGIVVCLYLIGMSVVFGLLSEQSYDFLRTARTTSGTVIALVPRAPVGSTREPRSGRTMSLAPEVSYQVGGQTYTYTAAHGRFRQPLKVGDTVAVLYDPSAPDLARMQGEGRVLVPAITATFIGCAVLVAAILVRTRNVGAPRSPQQTPGSSGGPGNDPSSHPRRLHRRGWRRAKARRAVKHAAGAP